MAFVQNMIAGLNLGKIGARKPPYHKVLDKNDFISSATVSLVAGTWNTIGSYRVPAQLAIAIGQGSPTEAMNQGYIYVYLKDNQGTPAELTGKFRIVISDANETDYTVILDDKEEVLHGDTSDKNKMKPLPLDRRRVAKEDDKILLQIIPDSATYPLSKANSTITIPVTAYPQ